MVSVKEGEEWTKNQMQGRIIPTAARGVWKMMLLPSIKVQRLHLHLLHHPGRCMLVQEVDDSVGDIYVMLCYMSHVL